MKPTQKTILLSYVLILPAVTLVTSGLLYLLFGWEQANNFLGALLNHGLTRPLLSPVVVLGGAFVAVLLNAPQLCRAVLRHVGLFDKVADKVSKRRHNENCALDDLAMRESFEP